MSFSLGLIEVHALGNAITIVDEMLKVADVEFVATERKLGGCLVTVVVRGTVSAVTASVEAGVATAEKLGCLKAAEVIARPHPEIFKFLHLEEKKVGTEKKLEKAPADKQTSSKAVSKKTASDKKTPVKRERKPKQS